MRRYDVYRSDENDITYTRNFYQGRNCSISVLRSQEPASLALFADQQNFLKINNADLERIQEANENSNVKGE